LYLMLMMRFQQESLKYQVLRQFNDCSEIRVERVSLPSIMIFTSMKSQMDLSKSSIETGEFKVIKDTLITMDTLSNLL